jgi:hypothetical protein
VAKASLAMLRGLATVRWVYKEMRLEMRVVCADTTRDPSLAVLGQDREMRPPSACLADETLVFLVAVQIGFWSVHLRLT